MSTERFAEGDAFRAWIKLMEFNMDEPGWVNSRNANGLTPLLETISMFGGESDAIAGMILTELLELGANPGLVVDVSYEGQEVQKINALLFAATRGAVEAFVMMYDHDPNSINILIEDDINAFMHLLVPLDEEGPIGLMNKAGYKALISSLVKEKHYDINALLPGSTTALEFVVANNRPIATKFLIELGAHVDAHILEVAAFAGASAVLSIFKECALVIFSEITEKLLKLSIAGFKGQYEYYQAEHAHAITFLADNLRGIEGDFQDLLSEVTKVIGAYHDSDLTVKD